ncbi:MAG: DUF1934 domain-containing protein [Vampirovibrio sp.]
MMSHGFKRGAVSNLRRRVNLEISHTHSVNYEEPIMNEQDATGSFFQVADETYIIAFDTELDGKRQTHTLKLQDGLMSWVIIGDAHTRQTFKQGEWYANQFFVDGATFSCRNRTRRMDYHFNQDGGFIDLFYELYSGETHLGYYSLEIYIH